MSSVIEASGPSVPKKPILLFIVLFIFQFYGNWQLNRNGHIFAPVSTLGDVMVVVIIILCSNRLTYVKFSLDAKTLSLRNSCFSNYKNRNRSKSKSAKSPQACSVFCRNCQEWVSLEMCKCVYKYIYVQEWDNNWHDHFSPGDVALLVYFTANLGHWVDSGLITSHAPVLPSTHPSISVNERHLTIVSTKHFSQF